MKDSKTSLSEKIIFHVLNKIFTKWYRTNSSRFFFKYFFGLIRRIKSNKVDLRNKKIQFTSENDILDRLGWVEFNESKLSKDILALRKIAIDSAVRIFESEFSENRSDKKYLRNIDLTNFPKEITSFHKFLTNTLFIKIISNYLGDTPLLTELKLLYSPPSNIMNFKGSQLFHSDFDDDKLVKIFVFVDNVDSDMGPLELIEKNDSKLIMEKVNYSWGQKSKNYSSHDDRLKDVLGKDPNRKVLVGPKGSIYFVDTVNCLHRGSRNPIKARKVLYANFSTRTSFRNPPLNWIFNNKLTLLKSSPMVSLDPKRKLNLDYVENKL